VKFIRLILQTSVIRDFNSAQVSSKIIPT